jgi:sulfate adenylyltransferase subunit 2
MKYHPSNIGGQASCGLERRQTPQGSRGRPWHWRYPLGFMSYLLDHLDLLEAEAIHIIREAASESDRPVVLFSGGKDSAVVLKLAVKAFAPARLPFPVMHVDTGHNFPEVIEFRDRTMEGLGVELIVASVQEAIDQGRVVEEAGPRASRNRLQTETLLTAVERHRFDLLFGGARRDEERARAKERVFSHRDEFGQWDPKNQRPELWGLYNPRKRPGESLRVFPISNWTEMDVMHYCLRQDIALPSIYFSHPRKVFMRDGMWMAEGPHINRSDGEEIVERTVRFRTVGDMSCTAAVESTAATLDEVIVEVAASRTSERGASRADDRTSEAAMEDRKREGYF